MQQVLSLGLWESVSKLAKRASPRLGAVAYVSNGNMVKFGKGDLLVVDASDAAIKSGATSAAALKAIVRRGADVVCVPGLHAKAMVLGDTAVIGSANISKSSMDSLIEAGLITTSPTVVSGIKSLVYQLAQSGTTVDADFLFRINSIPVVRHGGAGGKRSPRIQLGPLGGATWVIGVRQLPDDAHPDEDHLAESGITKAKEKRTYRNSQVDWVRFVGNGTFRTEAREGDLVIQIWRPLGRGPVEVFPHATILRRQDEEGTRTRFYLEERPGAANHTASLEQFRVMLRRHGFKAKIGQSSERLIDPLLSDALRECLK